MCVMSGGGAAILHKHVNIAKRFRKSDLVRSRCRRSQCETVTVTHAMTMDYINNLIKLLLEELISSHLIFTNDERRFNTS